MNNYVTEAINLKSYNLNDADKIIVMYSKENGLIKGVAKGIKKPKSKLYAITIFSEDNEGWYRPIGHANQS